VAASKIKLGGKRNAKSAKVSPVKDKLSNLKKRDYIIGDSDDFVHMDWSGEWSEMKNLEPLPDGHGSESSTE
jgi:hypothetical protein